MRKFVANKPIASCLVIEAIFLTAFLIMYPITRMLVIDTDVYNTYILKEIILAVVSFSLMYLVGKNYVLKRNLNIKNYFGGLLTGAFILVSGFITLFSGGMEIVFKEIYEQMGIETTDYVLQSPVHILVFIMYVFLIGVVEEVLFRGLIAEQLMKTFGVTKKGVIKAVVISGIMFGMAHMVNALNTGILSATVQAIIVSFMGMVFAIIYFKSGNIWSVITVHAFIDFAQLAFNGGIYGSPVDENTIANAMGYSFANLLGVVPYIILLFILLRNQNIKRIQINYTR